MNWDCAKYPNSGLLLSADMYYQSNQTALNLGSHGFCWCSTTLRLFSGNTEPPFGVVPTVCRSQFSDSADVCSWLEEQLPTVAAMFDDVTGVGWVWIELEVETECAEEIEILLTTLEELVTELTMVTVVCSSSFSTAELSTELLTLTSAWVFPAEVALIPGELSPALCFPWRIPIAKLCLILGEVDKQSGTGMMTLAACSSSIPGELSEFSDISSSSNFRVSSANFCPLRSSFWCMTVYRCSVSRSFASDLRWRSVFASMNSFSALSYLFLNRPKAIGRLTHRNNKV